MRAYAIGCSSRVAVLKLSSSSKPIILLAKLQNALVIGHPRLSRLRFTISNGTFSTKACVERQEPGLHHRNTRSSSDRGTRIDDRTTHSGSDPSPTLLIYKLTERRYRPQSDEHSTGVGTHGHVRTISFSSVSSVYFPCMSSRI